MTRPELVGDDDLPVDPDVGPDEMAETALDDRPRPSHGGRRRRRAEPSVLAAIALGGALGAPARYGVAQLIQVPPGRFPWATFWTNVSGTLALGLILSLVLERFPPSRYLRPFVATGFLGAYTTYSTFAVETVVLVKDGHPAVALAYAAGSLMAGFVVAWAGIWAARVVPLSGRGGRR
jgi:CrcB protein